MSCIIHLPKAWLIALHSWWTADVNFESSESELIVSNTVSELSWEKGLFLNLTCQDENAASFFRPDCLSITKHLMELLACTLNPFSVKHFCGDTVAWALRIGQLQLCSGQIGVRYERHFGLKIQNKQSGNPRLHLHKFYHAPRNWVRAADTLRVTHSRQKWPERYAPTKGNQERKKREDVKKEREERKREKTKFLPPKTLFVWKCEIMMKK